MKTTHEIIDEIAGHYNNKNRSVKPAKHSGEIEGSCQYNGPDGKYCAFSYMCINPKTDLPSPLEGEGAENIIRGQIPLMRMNAMKRAGIDHSKLRQGHMILKPEYRGHDALFYSDVQFLHDDPNNWTDDGLSDQGRDKVQEFKKKWINRKPEKVYQVFNFGEWITVPLQTYLYSINNNKEGRVLANGFDQIGKNYDGA